LTRGRILLHLCCGPCAVGPVLALREEGYEVQGFFANPNVQPFAEWLRRREAVVETASRLDIPLIIDDSYPVEEWLRSVVFREADRCRICYSRRLEMAAGVAKHGRFPTFTTTLLSSHQQDHSLLAGIGESAATAHGIAFLAADFRPFRKEGDRLAREWGIHHQDYCGCLYSEADRRLGKGRRRYREKK
jgi:predicted adenine nucleotide alpha hydrolase (AANH) superfamily ATPase